MAKGTVHRIRREKPPRKPSPMLSLFGCALRAKYPRHIFMADLSDIPGLFRILSFTLAVVFDVFSRMPLAVRVFLAPPAAPDIASLFQQVARRHGPPQHSVSDQGVHFTAGVFRKTLARLGVLHRYGAVGKTGSIALIERFWRTQKELLTLRLRKPVVRVDLQRRLRLALFYYAYLRPHQGLGGATPAEVYFGLPPAPPRGSTPSARSARRRISGAALEIAFLDPEQRYLTWFRKPPKEHRPPCFLPLGLRSVRCRPRDF